MRRRKLMALGVCVLRVGVGGHGAKGRINRENGEEYAELCARWKAKISERISRVGVSDFGDRYELHAANRAWAGVVQCSTMVL